MVREPRIRSELVADREKNPKLIEKAMGEKWGFYRPVNIDSADELSAVLNFALQNVQKYLKRKKQPIAHIEIQQDFGVTFVRRSEVGKKMFQAVVGGFRMAHAIEDLGRNERCIQEPLEVPLDLEKFAWYTNSERKAVSKFAESAELCRLTREQEIIRETLGEHGLKNVVSKPDHLTLFTYGYPRDKMGLTPIHKKAVSSIIQKTFESEGMEYVWLDPLNVGPSYTQPCDSWEKLIS